MFGVGDVIAFESVEAGKRKFHLCISFDGHYLFINSPKPRVYPGDFIVDCKELPFLTPTSSGKSVISCSLVMKKSEAELTQSRAKKLGSVSHNLLSDLIKFVQASPLLTEDEKDAIIEAAGDWA